MTYYLSVVKSGYGEILKDIVIAVDPYARGILWILFETPFAEVILQFLEVLFLGPCDLYYFYFNWFC